MRTHDIDTLLHDRFGFSGFREGQREIITTVLDGKDCVAVLPTGGGKSLTFQLPALMRPGITLVVSPLIALMKDQVDGLKRQGIPATALNSSLSLRELRDREAWMADGKVRLVYVAPERFRNERFLSLLPRVRLNLFVVDEAHCISQWGHDFRPDYLRLRQARERLGNPQALALTATATPEVREDIVHQLALADPSIVVRGFARDNLTLAVRRVASHAEKLARTIQILADHPTGIVYCATRANVDQAAARLQASGVRCEPYHAGLEDGARRATQNRFMSGQVPVVVATNAFGMGIDRADLRAIVHWDIPGSIEAYYQEAGRAGRDGEQARCELLFSHADIRTQKYFIEGANPDRSLVLATARALTELCAEGAVQLGPRHVAAHLGVQVNTMAVATAMGLLERAGLIARTPDPETGTPVIVLADARADLDEVLRPLAGKADRDRKRLRRLLRYAESRTCRHVAILRYFGDASAGERETCPRCDNCQRVNGDDRAARRAPAPAERLDIEKVLRCALRLGGRFGKARLAQVLTGSRDQAVLQSGLDQVTGYGALAGRSQATVKRLIDALLDEGCLEVIGDEYPTVRITRRGRDVAQGQADVELALPTAAAPAAAPTVASAKVGELAEALRALRARLARERGIPAYLILHNATIDEIAKMAPHDRAGLLAVKGIGPAKLADIGDEILRTIVNHEDEGASPPA